MTIRVVLSALAVTATVAGAQQPAARQASTQGLMCLQMDDIAQVEMVQGSAAVAEYGPAANNGLVVIKPKPGAPLSSILAPCQRGSSSQQDEPFGANLYSPAWVMSHQQAVGLSADQRSFLQSRIVSAQQQFAESDVKLRGEMEKLNDLLAGKQIDRSGVLESLDRVLAVERKMKRAQVSLMIDVKNKLTEQQQSRLDELRGGSDHAQTPVCRPGEPLYVFDGKPSCRNP